MANALPYFPFYPRDFVVDVQHMPAEAVGAYMLILCAAWNNGDRPGYLPNDPEVLAPIGKLSRAAWGRCGKLILGALKVSEDGAWVYSKRMVIEWEKVAAKCAQASEAGKASAASKAARRAGDVQRPLSERLTAVPAPPNDRTNGEPTAGERGGNEAEADPKASSGKSISLDGKGVSTCATPANTGSVPASATTPAEAGTTATWNGSRFRDVWLEVTMKPCTYERTFLGEIADHVRESERLRAKRKSEPERDPAVRAGELIRAFAAYVAACEAARVLRPELRPEPLLRSHFEKCERIADGEATASDIARRKSENRSVPLGRGPAPRPSAERDPGGARWRKDVEAAEAGAGAGAEALKQMKKNGGEG